MDAIHATVSGAGAQMYYPVARALEQFPLDTLAEVMTRADYKAVFYAASHRKFGDKGDVCEAYGYDHFTGCPDMAKQVKSNEWGG